jgi:hypothetical protein
MNRIRRRPRGDGFPGRLIQDMAAAAGVAVGQTVHRPWCLTCCQELHPDRYDVIPFDS